MSKHTPGPWEVDTSDGSLHISKSGKRRTKLAVVYPYPGRSYARRDEGKANAYLIAAAPEMYEALKIVNDFLLDIADEGDDCFKLVLNSVGYALAKAEGREVKP